MRPKRGRSKGSHNRGYWYRAGRGWYITNGKSAEPLRDAKGNHIRVADATEEVKQAYARYLLHEGQENEAPPAPPAEQGLTVMEACQLYLDHAQTAAHPETYLMRAKFLFDFCTGFPARFRESKVKPTPKDRIHPGYGAKLVAELTKLDVERWVKAHTGWKHPRAALQAIGRALNYCRESGLIETSPLRGLKVPKSGERVAYITPEVEEAIYQYASPPLALAAKVCIMTGARPDIEFAHLESRHVQEVQLRGGGRGQRWYFPASEAKGRRKERIIYIPEEIAQIVREQIKRHKGRVFRNPQGQPWTRQSLQAAFSWLKKKLLRKGITPANPFIPYTCRHTYAKRRLGGYWGPAITLEVLAKLMGNTPKIAFEHYADWCEAYTDPLWAAIGGGSNPARESFV